MCMKAELTLDDGTLLSIMTLGPICIHPDYKRQGYGKALLDNTLEKAAGFGFGAVCFEVNNTPPIRFLWIKYYICSALASSLFEV